MDTVTVSFDATVRQMTKMYQRKKTGFIGGVMA